jgi:glycosyltransferase involved in cell wall biosynthesis
MKVAIDARAYFQRTGIARYTRGLVHALDACDGPHDYCLLLSNQHRPEELALGPRMVARVSRAEWLAPDQAQRLDDDATAWGADLLHAIFPPLVAPTVPTVVTLFDVTPLTRPHLHQRVVRDAFARGWAQVVQAGAPVVAVSAATRAAAIALGATATQVAVIGIGLSAPFDTPAKATTGPRSGVLCVGTLEPRKNLPLLLDALTRLATDGRAATTLTVVGKQGWGDADTAQRAARLPWVTLAGFVSDDALLRLYRGAAILACPSMEEGFGLPVLEAMAQGALPLVSRDPALAELVDDPTLTVPADATAWAGAIALLLDDETARARQCARLMNAARQRTWAAVAHGWIEQYDRVRA